MKLAKRIATFVASVMMAATISSIGTTAAAYAPTSLNWSVSNVNNNILYNQLLQSNGYKKYSLSCTEFTGQNAADTYVHHYPYYVTIKNGLSTSVVCAPRYNITTTFSAKEREYTSSSIPTYGTEIHEVFRLYQPSSTTAYKRAAGVVKTVAGV